MLHALKRMDLDQEQGKISLTVGQAKLDVYLISDQDILFSQTDEFLVSPGDRYEGADNQFHFKAETSKDTATVKFLALFIPYRKGDVPPSVARLSEGSVRGYTIGEDRVVAWWGEGETGELGEGLPEGRMLVESADNGGSKKVVCE